MPDDRTAIQPTREENYPEWYQQVIKAAELAESSPVRGCMVIRPWGYSLWENIQQSLDARFKATGHQNAYFPLLIPMSYLEKEAEHVDGFAKECAVVTHHRLEVGPDGGLVPVGKLDEPLIIRPTSETIIGEMFSRWVESYRDLPLLINQWANVMRWEMRTRLFLRTSEFLWQEGHTVHATSEEAVEETMRMLGVYADFAETEMAMPVHVGLKTAGERFPGAVDTFSIESMMQDRKALQAGTSHFLGQNFSRASDIRFLDESGERVHAWTTSWGVSTRLIGALIMTHADDDGLVLPPRLTPVHVVILPLLHRSAHPDAVMNVCQKLKDDLRQKDFHGRGVEVLIDERDMRGGEKTWSWVKKGVPLRVEIGAREIEGGSVCVARRDRTPREKETMSLGDFVASVVGILDELQQVLLDRAQQFRDSHTRQIDTRDDFTDFFTPPSPDPDRPTPIHGGFALTHFSGDEAMERSIAEELGVTIRCIPMTDLGDGPGTCPFTGDPSPQRLLWAKAY